VTKYSIQIYTPPTLAVATLQVRAGAPVLPLPFMGEPESGESPGRILEVSIFFPTPIMLYAPPSGPTAQGLSSILNDHSRQRQDSACINTAAAAID
jgi:hypothetical protein